MRFTIEAVLAEQVASFTSSAEFRRIESGEATHDEYDAFLANLVRTHLRSPKVVAFLYALSPPDAATALLSNLLEELGLEDPSGVAHPEMLHALAAGAGLAPVMPELERQADEALAAIASEPLLFGSLREVGLAGLVEVVAFEFMLSRTAGRIGRALSTHRGLDPTALMWFHHHSEVDVAHAEQGLQHVEDYVRYYGFTSTMPNPSSS